MKWIIRIAVVFLVISIFGCGKRDERHVAPLVTTIAHTGSMKPTFMGGETVFVKKSSIEDVKVGDIIDAYWAGIGKNVGHRVIAIRMVNGQIGLVTKGDANLVRDEVITTKENFNGIIIKLR